MLPKTDFLDAGQIGALLCLKSKGPNESRVAKIWKEGGGISSDDETILQRRREENDWVFGKSGASVWMRIEGRR